jgi:ATP-binding protein involved in chromosome partitioning
MSGSGRKPRPRDGCAVATAVPWHVADEVDQANGAGQTGGEPTTIDVDRQVGVTLRWSDGSLARFALVELRLNCPCAECQERRRAGETVWPRPGSPQPLGLLDARLVGTYGIAFEWNDGHATGIYTWDALRQSFR